VAAKRHNQPGDVVLVHIDGKPAAYARLEEIRSHPRPGWFECDLLLLAQPLQAVTWILEREQIDGSAFTMGGRPVQIEVLPELGGLHARRAPAEPAKEASPPAEPKPREGPDSREPRESRRGNVVPLFPGSPEKR